MSSWPIFFLFSLFAFSTAPYSRQSLFETTKHSVLVVGIDGLRPDFVTPKLTPNLHQIAKKGVFAKEGIRTQFPSSTVVNFCSISTGIIPDNSGIVGNWFILPKTQEVFDYNGFFAETQEEWEAARNKSIQPRWWRNLEPIWILNQKAGHCSGGIGWPTGDAIFEGGTMTRYEAFRKSLVSFDEAGVDKILSWFLDDDKPINLGFLYSAEPDITEHRNDIFSEAVREKIKRVDDVLGYLIQEVNKLGLEHLLDIIIVSDHGFTNIHRDTGLIDISQFGVINKDFIPSFFSMWPFPGSSVDELFERVKSLADKEPRFKVWMKNEVPDYLRYSTSENIGPIVVQNTLGHFFTLGPPPAGTPDVFGAHGTSPEYMEMRAVFVASGPSFKEGYELPEGHKAENIDIFDLLAWILYLVPSKTDGNFYRIAKVLKDYDFIQYHFGF